MVEVRPRDRRRRIKPALALCVALASLALAGCGEDDGFAKADLDAMKKSIRTEFEKRDGITVVDVVMLRETPKKATGYVKLKAPVLGEITKPCGATMAEGGQYIWQCQ